MDAPPPAASVLIATFNRAAMLDDTLGSLGRMGTSPALAWECLVIDNNSTDDTAAVVERHSGRFPVPLRYLVEARQGRSSALNTGIAAAHANILVFTDDDVRVADGWLDAACDALKAPDDGSIGFAGGPVRPRWEAAPPPWLDLDRGDLWGTIAIQDHGSDRFVYEERRKVPLGANMAVRREVFDRAGLFRADLGRTGGGPLLLGQEVPEFLIRARAAGFRGVYLPAMEVHHHIPASRLTPHYFRRWWFGKGVSRSGLERLQPRTETGVDLTRTPHLLDVPRYMYGLAVRDAAGWLSAAIRRRRAEAFRRQMMLAYFCGYFWSRRQRRGAAGAAPRNEAPHTASSVPTSRRTS